MQAKKCPECGNSNLKHNAEKGEIICQECGLVLEDKLVDFDKEWREFESSDGSKRRTGAPLTYTQADQGLGTEVGRSADLSRLTKKQRDKFYRLRLWQRRVGTAIERNLQLALSEIKRLISYLELPSNVEEESARIYTMAVQRGLVRGRSTEIISAAAVYAACRQNEIPRTISEFSNATSIEEKELGRNYRFLTRRLELKIMPTNPATYVARLSSSLKLSPETQTLAVTIIERAQKAELTSGKSPQGIAAAAVYMAAMINDEKTTQQRVGEEAGVTEVTIRNRYKELQNNIDLKAIA
jgi:transcription initiation factor TFIIB